MNQIENNRQMNSVRKYYSDLTILKKHCYLLILFHLLFLSVLCLVVYFDVVFIISLTHYHCDSGNCVFLFCVVCCGPCRIPFISSILRTDNKRGCKYKYT